MAVSAQGQGGRQVRTEPDQLFDHEAVEFSFPDGTRLMVSFASSRAAGITAGCVVHGKGSAQIGEGVLHPRLYKDYTQTHAGHTLVITNHRTTIPISTWSMDLLFEATPAQNKRTTRTVYRLIRRGWGFLGRMAAHSGKMVTWDEELRHGPRSLELCWDSLGTQWIHGPRSCRFFTVVIRFRHAGDDEGVLVGHKASKRVLRGAKPIISLTHLNISLFQET